MTDVAHGYDQQLMSLQTTEEPSKDGETLFVTAFQEERTPRWESSVSDFHVVSHDLTTASAYAQHQVSQHLEGDITIMHCL